MPKLPIQHALLHPLLHKLHMLAVMPLTLQRPLKLCQRSQVHFLVSHTWNNADTFPANTRRPSGDQATLTTPPLDPLLMHVPTPKGMSHSNKLLSLGEEHTTKFPQGLQESDVIGVWPGEDSYRTHVDTNLKHIWTNISDTV